MRVPAVTIGGAGRFRSGKTRSRIPEWRLATPAMALLASLALAAAAPAAAQSGGALPKGTLPAGGDKPLPPAKKPAGGRPSCWRDHANVPGGNIQWSRDGTAVWVLGRTEARAGGKGKTRSDQVPRQTLYKVSLAFQTAEPVLALDAEGSGSLILEEDPPVVVTIAAFTGEGASCFEGDAGVVRVAIDGQRKGQAAVQSRGRFMVVEGAGVRHIADMVRGSLVEVDSASFQSKFIRTFGASERPLYYDGSRFVTWFADARQRGLVGVGGDGKLGARRLAFAPGDRLLMDRGRFAALTTDVKANVLRIRELADWSGVEKPGIHEVKLPTLYSVSAATVDAYLPARVALVQAASGIGRQQWRRVFVVDYAKGEISKTVETKSSEYIQAASLGPTGEWAVFEIRDNTQRLSRAVQLLNLKTGKLVTVALDGTGAKKAK